MKLSLSDHAKYAQAIIKVLRTATSKMPPPMSLVIKKEFHNDPFLILISCLLSLRARDTVTLPISRLLFKQARTAKELLAMPVPEVERIIKPIGFYRNKAKTLHSVSRELLERFSGKVPATEEKLLSIKGVGRKTANLVLGVAFNVPAICVDTHVHRLANALGLVSTTTPEQTEIALKKLYPKNEWKELNTLLVMWGQNIPRKQQVALLKKLVLKEQN